MRISLKQALSALASGVLYFVMIPLSVNAAPALSLKESSQAPPEVTYGEREYTGMNIRCFDVNEKGEMLLLFEYNPAFNEYNYANIYRPNGSFAYSMTWESYGDSLAWWEGDDPAVYLLRRDLVYVTGYATGQPRCLEETAYQYPLVEAYESEWLRERDGYQYQNQYEYFLMTAPDGTQTEVYRNGYAKAGIYRSLLIAGLLIAVAVTAVVRKRQDDATEKTVQE